MSSTVVLKAAGLVTTPNQLDLPDGSLTEAKNVVIDRDGIIEPRRGYKIYGNELPNITQRVKQLVGYRERILRHYADKLAYDSDGEGNFIEFGETVTEAYENLRLRTVEANGNLYLATNEGIKKLSATSADDFSSTSIEKAGAVKAVDLTSSVIYSFTNQSGFLPQDSKVAYRVVWAKHDNNNNLLRGTPSQRSVVELSLQKLLINDFNNVLYALDNITDTTTSARIGDGDYSQSLALQSSVSAVEVYQALISLATKIDNDIIYGDGGTSAPIDLVGASGTVQVSGNVATMTKEAGADFTDYLLVGSEIDIEGLLGANAVLNGTHTVSAVTANTIQFNITTADFGPNATDSSVILKSNEFRSITQPTEPGLPVSNGELVALQTYLDSIIQLLQDAAPNNLLSGIVITSQNQTDFIAPLDITTSANVLLKITVPQDATTDYFLQVYRSSIVQATGTTLLDDIFPNDELQLVYEKYLTDAEKTAGIVEITDETPDDFRGENLYTNADTGEGITQANDIPPFAKDINRFRNVVFYANTRTRHRMQFQLLGVQNIITDINNSIVPKITVTNSTNSQTYTFVLGKSEITDIDCVADVANSLNGTYFDVGTANNNKLYRFYFKTSGGTNTPPATGGRTLYRINIQTNASNTEVAQKVIDTFNTLPDEFYAEENTLPKIRVTTVEEGRADDFSAGTSGFTMAKIQDGQGEDASTRMVLVSNLVSPARAVDATARSLVRVINQNSNGIVYAYYLSSVLDVPGKILFESRDITDDKFYITTNNAITGASFNPDFSSEFSITNIDASTDVVTTNTNHNYKNGQNIIISQTDTVPSLDGIHQIEVLSPTTFKIVDFNITTVNSNVGVVSSKTFAEFSENEQKQNRMYFSKFQQPEAVPIVNYFDVGAEDKAILRIFPLQDSLFVFKEDGLYRVSGETSPFNQQLFDSSCILIADDSVDVSNNRIFCWTTQGMSIVVESGVNTDINRPIEEELKRLASSRFTNFRYATWGVGYESDNSYTVYTIQNPEDTTASIGYRYSSQTDTWTNIDKSPTCGIINNFNDKMYLGASDVPYIEIERKDFERTDYADREYVQVLGNGKYANGVVILDDISKMSLGDVIVQRQPISIYDFNSLLRQLDLDTGLSLSLKNGDVSGYISLEAKPGDNLRNKLLLLTQRLDSDSGAADSDYEALIAQQVLTINDISVGNPTGITTTSNHNLFNGRIVSISGTNSDPLLSGNYIATVVDADTFSIPVEVVGTGTTGAVVTDIEDFQDIKVCFNSIVNKLNNDNGVNFTNYKQINTITEFEAIITAINGVTKAVTLSYPIEMISGTFTHYTSIKSSVVYAPNTMADPLGLKHLREATMIFLNRAFTSGVMKFATDLLPEFQRVNFNLDGNGSFGSGNFGSGFFGGGSNSAPFRTYIPRQCQRCTFIRVGFEHNVAREKYLIQAVTVTGNIGLSTRAYR